MKKYFVIMEWTPCPGYFLPLPAYAWQVAEFKLGFNKTYYGERAKCFHGLNAYGLGDALKIVDYWQSLKPFAKYELVEVRVL